jgi:hypothetical protein
LTPPQADAPDVRLEKLTKRSIIPVYIAQRLTTGREVERATPLGTGVA